MPIVTGRRTAAKLALAASLAPLLGGPAARAASAARVFAPAPSRDWRRFETSLTVKLPKTGATAEVWLPVPGLETAWQHSLDNQWTGNAAAVALHRDPLSGARFFAARFDTSVAPELTLTSSFATKNRTIDWSQKTNPHEDPAVLAAALRPTASKPLDGLIRATAQQITQGTRGDLEQVRAIYAWIVGHCYRNLATPGCGPGDARATLTSAGLGGKCADLNGLFVALTRAVGVPARDIYGVRVAPSEFGFKQLGASGDITGAQHCRAEAWLSGYGWVAMDPADVLKVMRAETATWIRDPADPLVAGVNAALFGNWEGNWVGYGTAEDVALPNHKSRLPFLMYPQGRIGTRSLDELDPKAFSYAITARSI
jgi:transglutaminase-like putative cysteine protease